MAQIAVQERGSFIIEAVAKATEPAMIREGITTMPRKTRGDAPAKIVEAARENRRKLTVAEMRLWNALRGRRLASLKFRLQHPFGRFVLDFFCLERNLAVEVDGGIHNEPGQKEYDADRTQYLNDQGIRVLRFKNEEVLANLDQVVLQIKKATEQ